jgi:predicted DNA-binding transcriptional regulator YafY
MQTIRQLEIINLLADNGRLTAKELAARLNVSDRTILRDIDALAKTGVPVNREQGKSGGFSLPKGYKHDSFAGLPLLKSLSSTAVLTNIKPPKSENEINIKLRFSKKAADRMLNDFSSDNVKANDDGSYTVSANFTDNGALYRYILSYGAAVTVLSPRHVREELLKQLKKIRGNYK